jgi:NADH:ubiquinone oxidoreductase subunit K
MSAGLPFLLIVASCLFGLGAFGMMARRNAMSTVCSAALLLLAAVVAVIGLRAFAVPAAGRSAGSALAIVLGAMIAAELALAVSLARSTGPVGHPVEDAAGLDA